MVRIIEDTKSKESKHSCSCGHTHKKTESTRYIATKMKDGRYTVYDTYYKSTSGAFKTREEAEDDAKYCNDTQEKDKRELAMGGLMLSDEYSRMAKKPYKKVESLDDGAQYVLYKDLGGFKMTDKANYDSRISNARKVMDFKEFDNIDEILDYAEKHLRIGRENVIITSSAKRESTTKARK